MRALTRFTQGEARHRARTAPSSFRGIVGTALAVAGAVVVAAAMSGGSYALWRDNAVIPAGTVQSGTISLTVSGAPTATAWSNLLAGEAVRQSVTLTNSGTVGLTLSGTATTGSASYEVRLVRGTCPTAALTGIAASTSATALSTLAAGAVTTVCVEVKLLSTAAIGSTASIAVAITGTQS